MKVKSFPLAYPLKARLFLLFIILLLLLMLEPIQWRLHLPGSFMNIFLYVVTVCIWSTTWLAITYQLGVIPIDLSIFYRFGAASLLVFIWCLLRGLNLRFSLKDHLFFIGQGFFLFSMNYMASYEASSYIPSGLNAIGFSLVLLCNIINSAIFYRTPLTLQVGIGALSGLMGITVIFWPMVSIVDLSNTSLIGIFLSVLGGLLTSFGNMISARNHKKKIPVMESNAYAMGYGALWILGLIWAKGIPLQFDFSYSYVFTLFYLSVFGSVIAFGCYLTLLGRIGASKAAYTIIMVPMVALLISAFFENFAWGSHTLVGIGLIVLGNIIILSRKTQYSRILKKFSPSLQSLKEAT